MAKNRKKKKKPKKRKPGVNRSPSVPQWYLNGLGDWTTEDILVELKKYDLDMDEKTYQENAGNCNEPSIIAGKWIARIKAQAGRRQDFFQFSARELWRRLLPDRDCLDLLEEDLAAHIEGGPSGIGLSESARSEEEVKTIMHHLERLDMLLAQKSQGADENSEDLFDKISDGFSADLQLWLLELPWELANDGFIDEGVAIAEKYSFLDPGNMLGDIGHILAENDRCQEALSQVEENLKNLSNDAWVAIKAGDVYDTCEQPERAIELYLKALEMTSDPFTREGAYERLIPLYERMGKDKEKRALEDLQAKDMQEEMDYEPVSSYGPPPIGKVGRNEPCPCGSGKKYKKCCLIKEG